MVNHTFIAMAISYNWLVHLISMGLYIHSINGVSSVLLTGKGPCSYSKL